MLLRHFPLPSPTSYLRASALQTSLVAALLAHKAAASSPSSSSSPPPSPSIITAQFPPTYTCGRREIPSISPSQISHLTSPTPHGRAEFFPALRGGQTTFHGPGQLVAYPILDLKRHGLTPRCYVNLLEETVIGLCEELGLGRGKGRVGRTGNPGVWVFGNRGTGEGKGEGGKEREKKVCAVGVHLRRNVTAHGIGLNVSTEMEWFGRIVACGLEGLGTTSLELEGIKGLTVEGVGEGFVRRLAERLEGVEGVVRVEADAIEDLG